MRCDRKKVTCGNRGKETLITSFQEKTSTSDFSKIMFVSHYLQILQPFIAVS